MTIKKQSYRSGPFQDFIAQAVRVGNQLFLSGQVGMDENGKVGEGAVEQTHLAYENIKHVLAQFNASLDNVVDETMFVTDIDQIMANAEDIYGVRAQAYGGTPEVCQTLLEVSKLVLPELMLEIKCVALLDD